MKSSPATASRRDRFLVTALAMVGGVLFFQRLWVQLTASRSYYGTSRAPYSDALDPWLRGTLSYYFHSVPTPGLYRPTAGLIYSSLLSSFGSIHIDWIPFFFAICLLGVFAVFFCSARPIVAAPVALWLLFAVAHFGEVIAPLNVGSLQVDFPSFVLTYGGLLFLILAFTQRPVSATGAALAFLLLGMSAAIRGPLILAGVALLIGASVLLYRERQLRGILLLSACFLIPMLFDWSVQKSYHIATNGIVDCFSVYADPHHTWTPAANEAYEALKPSAADVLVTYLRFILFGPGISVVYRYFTQQLYSDACLLVAPMDIGVLLLALLCLPIVSSSWLAQLVSERAPGEGSRLRGLGMILRNPVVMTRVLVPCLLLSVLAVGFPLGGLVAWVLICWMLAVSLSLRLHCATACFLTYLLSLLFLSLLGLVWLQRLALTVTFCLPLGFYFLLLENPSATKEVRPTRPLLVSSITGAVILLWLYSANFVLNTQPKQAFRDKAEGRLAAIKVSDEARFGLSLYYTGDRRLLYTARDGVPIGTVRSYRSITARSGGDATAVGANKSFEEPVKFEE